MTDLSDTLKRILAYRRIGDPKFSQRQLVEEINETQTEIVSEKDISDAKNDRSIRFGADAKLWLARILDSYMVAKGIDKEELDKLANATVDRKTREKHSPRIPIAQPIPGKYAGVWLGVHYPTIRVSRSETEVTRAELRSYILIYEGEEPTERRFTILGNSTMFLGAAYHNNLKIFLQGEEQKFRNEYVYLILNEALWNRKEGFFEQVGILSGVGNGGVQTRHIFSVKTYLMKLNGIEDIESFKARIQDDAELRNSWCNRFPIGAAQWQGNASKEINLVLEKYSALVQRQGPEDEGDRISVT